MSNPSAAATTNDDNIQTLIQETTARFHKSNTDVLSLQKTAQDIKETDRERREVLQDARATLQQLSRKLHKSRMLGSREHVAPDSLKHDDRMMELDQQRFTLAREIQDLDQDIGSLEAELHMLRKQNEELDTKHPVTMGADAGSNAEAAARRASTRSSMGPDADLLDDGEESMSDKANATAILRLQIFRGLGIEMLQNDFGEYSKARIRSKNDVHVVNLDQQLSSHYLTNLIWDFAS
ncbi:kinetochore-associated Ndc80 complex subunit spc24 [Mortierella polycephala]|uniref:Kinetochore protein Spc24 n=1 Tax=Mortierella polycephala TaxID=41804 RepID=A0A9P6Q359_9FUNG|nr:kinetochore-associated Ndc80 complex subunit spc24 [Mortierella polycephala]